MEALTKDPENSDKGKNNAHHDKADSSKQQLVVKLVLINRLRCAADTDAADRGQRTDDDSVCSDDDTFIRFLWENRILSQADKPC